MIPTTITVNYNPNHDVIKVENAVLVSQAHVSFSCWYHSIVLNRPLLQSWSKEYICQWPNFEDGVPVRQFSIYASHFILFWRLIFWFPRGTPICGICCTQCGSHVGVRFHDQPQGRHGRKAGKVALEERLVKIVKREARFIHRNVVSNLAKNFSLIGHKMYYFMKYI